MNNKTHSGLRVAILSAHGEVEPELVAVNDVDVARLGPAEGVDPAAERPVRVDVDDDARVLTMDSHCVTDQNCIFNSNTIIGRYVLYCSLCPA